MRAWPARWPWALCSAARNFNGNDCRNEEPRTMTISRRAFMKAGGLALVSLGADPIFLDRAAYALGAARGARNARKTLVCLFQRGAVDGLSMIVPAGDAWYWQERQRIALPREELIPLDG